MRTVPIKDAKQVAASNTTKVTNLDEKLILVLTLEWAKADVLQASRLRKQQHTTRKHLASGLQGHGGI